MFGHSSGLNTSSILEYICDREANPIFLEVGVSMLIWNYLQSTDRISKPSF
jgi:hypothetical protein